MMAVMTDVTKTTVKASVMLIVMVSEALAMAWGK